MSVTIERITDRPDEETATLDVDALDVVRLGRQGETGTQTVEIDCSAWLTELPGAELLVAALRPGETAVYLPEVTAADGVLTWAITAEDTALAGWGKAEVRAMKDGAIKKSAVFRTRVEPGLMGEGVTPVTPPDWVESIIGAVDAAQADADAAQADADAAEADAAAAAASATAAAGSAAAAAAALAAVRWVYDGNGTLTYSPTT